MARPITLFTGQWADLPFEEVARLAGEWGYDGLEIACWGDHFDPWAAVEDDAYVRGRRDILEKHGLQVFAISNHLTGQAVCDDPIDERHRGILSDRIWGDGDAEGVRQRAAEELKTTARAVTFISSAARCRTPSASPSPQIRSGRMPRCRSSIGSSQTACPVRWLEIANRRRPWRSRISCRLRT